MHIDATLTHTTLTLQHSKHTCILTPHTHFTDAAAALFIIYPDCLVTFTPTHMYILYYLNYLNSVVPLHIDSVLVLLVYSHVIVFIVLLIPFFFCKYFLYF